MNRKVDEKFYNRMNYKRKKFQQIFVPAAAVIQKEKRIKFEQVLSVIRWLRREKGDKGLLILKFRVQEKRLELIRGKYWKS